MKLIFKNSAGQERVIAEVKDEEAAMIEITKFCEERSFHIYYTRTWEKDGRVWVDCGSHSEFFIVEK